jgi:uncharacterized protein YrzB (UPF0473 family)
MGATKRETTTIWDEQGEEQLFLGINKIAKTYSLGNAT